MSPRSYRKQGSAVNFKKHMTSMSYKPEPVIWSRNTSQRIPSFDRCQLTMTWMSNIRRTLSTYYLEYGRHVARLRRRRVYAPASNTASYDNHEKINSWVSFSFLYEYGAPLGGLRAAGAPLRLLTSYFTVVLCPGILVCSVCI